MSPNFESGKRESIPSILLDACNHLESEIGYVKTKFKKPHAYENNMLIATIDDGDGGYPNPNTIDKTIFDLIELISGEHPDVHIDYEPVRRDIEFSRKSKD